MTSRVAITADHNNKVTVDKVDQHSDNQATAHVALWLRSSAKEKKGTPKKTKASRSLKGKQRQERRDG
ncbi:hypothetical protein HaLaN_17105, partial [Haematococcus lacustris]